jgi:hypothetical protein
MISVALLLATSPVVERGPWDNYSGPTKLVITWYQSGIVAIDYPNRARCEAARAVVLARGRERARQIGMPLESADNAFCIPG